MASNPQPSASSPPPKPWEQSGSSSGPTPFKPPSPGSTSDVVEASGTAKPGEIVPATQRNAAVNSNAIGRSVPTRPWEQQTYGSTLGGYGTGLNNVSGYGSGMYGGSYGGLGGSYGGVGSYGGGMYGNSMYRGGVGGGLYGGSSMYGGGMYSGGLGGQMGGYGMGTGMGMGMGGPYGNQDPNNPYGAPPSPPGFWMSFLRVMEGVVTFFGRVAILIDQNTQAFHMFISALLQLCDRSGMLYGELARFVLRLLGVRAKNKMVQQPPPGPNGLPHNQNGGGGHNGGYIEAPKAGAGGPSGSWDGVWGGDGPQ